MPSPNVFARWSCALILALLLSSAWPAHPLHAAPAGLPIGGGLAPTFSDLIYGTYLGGTGYESYPSIGVDAAGNAYVAASTFSKDFPGFLYGSRSAEMVTAASISPDGRRLNYVGMIGGSRGMQLAQGIAVATDGTAYITGMTNAKDFPVTPDNGGTPCGRANDVFFVILDPSGGLRFSGCWGGTGWDQPLDIALTPEGDVVITGYTFSNDFPTTPSAFQVSYVDSYEAFVLRLHRAAPVQTRSAARKITPPETSVPAKGPPDGSAPDAAATAPDAWRLGPDSGEQWSAVAATYLGGVGDDRAYDVAVDAGGGVLVAGQAGDNFPVTPGAFQTTRTGSIIPDAFVTHLSPDLSTAFFSTYLGGDGADTAKAAAFAWDGIVVTGLTKSDLLVPEGAYDRTGDRTDGDVFVAKLDPSGSRLLASTYIGLGGQDEPSSLLVDDRGYLTLSGVSQMAFPTTPGSFDPTYNGLSETWLCRLDPSLRELTYSTLVGGAGLDGLRSFQGNTLRAPVARLPGDPTNPGRFSPDDSFYLATITFSNDWPISGASFQSKLNYQWDLGIVRLRVSELRAVLTGAPVRIDGVFTGWRSIPGVVLNSRNASAMTLRPPSSGKTPVPPSPADASGRLQLQWDSEGLYVAASIADDDVLAPVGLADSPDVGGLNDAVELVIQVHGQTRKFSYPAPDAAGSSALVRTPNGWAFEVAITTENLGLPPHGLVAGENLQINWTIIDEDTRLSRQSLTLTGKVTLLQ